MKLKNKKRKGIAISGSIIATLIGVGLTGFLGLQLISALEVVASYASLGGALLLSGFIVYYGFEGDYLDGLFSSEDVELLFLILIGVGVAPLSYMLFEGLISSVGSLVGGLVIGLVTLAIYFSPAFVLGGLASIAGFLADLIDVFGGDS